MEKPAYCLIVQGLPEYIVALGPLIKGAAPGVVSVNGKPLYLILSKLDLSQPFHELV